MSKGADQQLLIGSGKHGLQLHTLFCANFSTCSKAGSKVCHNCKLVAYCSKECQQQHWRLHKTLCKSGLIQESWTPSWIKESRLPVTDQEPDVPPLDTYIWGINAPAYGVLGSAEAQVQLPHDLRVCFAASCDLRNVIETVCQIPDNFEGTATIYVNDANPRGMVRNFLMLQLLRVHDSQAIDAVIALWYSVALTSAQLKATKLLARQFLQSFALGTDGEYSADLQEYNSSDPLGSSRSEVKRLVARFGKPTLKVMEVMCENSMPIGKAKETRREVMSRRPDLVDRRMSRLRSGHRLAWYHFRETGLLLPFASQAAAAAGHYSKTNRFLVNSVLGWLLGDVVEPLDHGWDIRQVLASGRRHGVPVNDLYGCLFFHLRSKLQSFLDKWTLCRVSLELTDMAPSELAADLRLRKVSLHRIDTRNLADESYNGIKRVLKDWGPLLLASPSASSSSSSTASSSSPVAALSLHSLQPRLITYFVSWAAIYNHQKSLTSLDIMKEDEEQQYVRLGTSQAELRRALGKAWEWGSMKEGFSEFLLCNRGNDHDNWYTYFHDFSKAFDEYLGMHAAIQAAEIVGMERKQKHEVVPHRLFVPVSACSSTTPADLQGSSFEDFYVYTGLSNRTQSERFVEWARTNEASNAELV